MTLTRTPNPNQAQRPSYDRLMAEGEAPLPSPTTNYGTHLQFEAKWREVLSSFGSNNAAPSLPSSRASSF